MFPFVSDSKPPCGEGKGVSETEIPGIPPFPASSRWDPAGSKLGGEGKSQHPEGRCSCSVPGNSAGIWEFGIGSGVLEPLQQELECQELEFQELWSRELGWPCGILLGMGRMLPLPKIPSRAIPRSQLWVFPTGMSRVGSLGMTASSFIPNGQSLSWQIQEVYPAIPGSSRQFIPLFLTVPGSLSRYSWQIQAGYPAIPGGSMRVIPLFPPSGCAGNVA